MSVNPNWEKESIVAFGSEIKTQFEVYKTGITHQMIGQAQVEAPQHQAQPGGQTKLSPISTSDPAKASAAGIP